VNCTDDQEPRVDREASGSPTQILSGARRYQRQPRWRHPLDHAAHRLASDGRCNGTDAFGLRLENARRAEALTPILDGAEVEWSVVVEFGATALVLWGPARVAGAPTNDPPCRVCAACRRPSDEQSQAGV